MHVNVEPDSPNNVEEIKALVVGQCNKRVGKQPSHSETSAEKKRKGQPIEYITDVVMEFTNMSRKKHSDKDSDSQKEIVESVSVGDKFSMDKVVAIFNSIENVNNYTMFKVLNELHKPDSKVAFIMLRLDKRRGWMDLVNSLM